jgi:hypothetical protein
MDGRIQGRLLPAVLAATLLLAGCGPAGSGGQADGGATGGAPAAENTVTGTLRDAQSLSGQEIVRITIRLDDGTTESMDVDDPFLKSGGLTPAEVRARVGKRVTVEFRDDGGTRVALRVTDAAP